MTKRTLLLLCTWVAACGTSADTNSPAQSQAIAMLRQPVGGELTIAVTSEEHLQQLQSVLSDTPPTNFRWLKSTIGADDAASIYGAGGYTADLSVATSSFTITQTFPDACNPSTGNYSTCWFVEKLTSGGEGSTGVASISATESTVTASLDVMFEGTSTRHGQPEYFKHETVSSFDAAIVSGGRRSR